MLVVHEKELEDRNLNDSGIFTYILTIPEHGRFCKHIHVT